MDKPKYQIIRDKKITDSYAKKFSIFIIIDVLRHDNESPLWNKLKESWTLGDWKEFFKLKIDNYGNDI